ncbi:hypothetical protein Y032_0241g3397 [Ancylostoma ceylanicum]|uniref:Uncharacterized protein n=1 Tax=Ancylostoma ceylanicum TaxID=53326 RepID=A0A016SEK6_9BILA|nr:hypothetical protein Y032_0241g3397 [Ancylostoma ceylanicum]
MRQPGEVHFMVVEVVVQRKRLAITSFRSPSPGSMRKGGNNLGNGTACGFAVVEKAGSVSKLNEELDPVYVAAPLQIGAEALQKKQPQDQMTDSAV